MKSYSKGFTLVELMIVVAIVAILAMIAYPAYTSYAYKVNRSGAQQALSSCAMAMEKVRLEQQGYNQANGPTTAVSIARVRPVGTLCNSQAPLEAGTKTYDITIHEATKTTFILRATPINGRRMSGDGFFELHHTGRKGWDQNNAGGISGTEWCWSTTKGGC